MSNFTIALVGKPNVGKSTLFNLLSKKKLAIVESSAGITVDFKENIISLFNSSVKIIDTGGISTTINNKDIKDNNEVLGSEINKQAILAIKKSNLILFIVDAKLGLTQEDINIANLLRKLHKDIVLVINKVDNKASEFNSLEAQSLGFKTTVKISAMHKIGLTNLYSAIKPLYVNYILNTKATTSNNKDDINPFLSIAIVGKPNTGKSTLINSLLKEKRLAVTNIAGTTKDSIPTYLTYNNKIIKIIDTAGLAKKSKIKKNIDILAKNETIRSIIFAQVVILVIDATEGLTKQDLSLASYVLKEGRALIILLNKIDLIKNPEKLKKEINIILNTSFSEVKGLTIILTSGLKNINLNYILKECLRVYTKWTTLIKTSLLNRWLKNILLTNPPPLYNGRTVKIKYISQEKTRPPTFNLWVNIKNGLPLSYLGFLRNQMYSTFKLNGIPLRFNIKTSKNPYIKD